MTVKEVPLSHQSAINKKNLTKALA